MRGLKAKTGGLLLLTATPMQVHPAEVWDLLDLLGLPPEWTEAAFLDFFEAVARPNPPADAPDRMARLLGAERSRKATIGGRSRGRPRLPRRAGLRAAALQRAGRAGPAAVSGPAAR